MALIKECEPEKAFTSIPEELKELPQWVVWGVDKTNPKKPHSPETLSPDDWRNPKNWGEFSKALRRINSSQAKGVGFAFNGNGIYGVDLDNVFIDGELIPEAKEVVNTLKSYTEVSQSGSGLHIIVEAIELDLKISKVVCDFTNYPKDEKRHIEFYQSTGYFAMTGNVYGEFKHVNEGVQGLKEIYDKYSKPLKNEPKQSSLRQQYETLFDNDTLIEKALAAKDGDLFYDLFTIGLWDKYHDRYPSKSEADIGLCILIAFWAGRNAAQIDEIFRLSALMSDKWDESKHRAADSATYGKITIESAIRKCNDVYHAYESFKPTDYTDSGNAAVFCRSIKIR